MVGAVGMSLTAAGAGLTAADQASFIRRISRSDGFALSLANDRYHPCK